MNERIQKLVKQARKKPLGDSWTYCHFGEFEERLAKLIIRECADIAYKCDDLSLGQSYTVAKHIKKQFGIEE